jgi:carbamoyltransferase
VNVLGLSAFYHDSAACLVRDGRIVAAAEEERFSRKKHDARLPAHALTYCLKEGGITPGELDAVAFYEKPLLKLDRILETHLDTAPLGFSLFRKTVPTWLGERIFIPRAIDHALGGRYEKRLVFMEHHEAHAASAFFPSPFDEAAIVTLDGAQDPTHLWVIRGGAGDSLAGGPT